MKDDIMQALQAARWIFARTMPENPHWYTPRRERVQEVPLDEVVPFNRGRGEAPFPRLRPPLPTTATIPRCR